MKPAHHQFEVPRALAGPGRALRLRADAVGRVAGARLDAPALVGPLRPAVQLERRRPANRAMGPKPVVPVEILRNRAPQFAHVEGHEDLPEQHSLQREGGLEHQDGQSVLRQIVRALARRDGGEARVFDAELLFEERDLGLEQLDAPLQPALARWASLRTSCGRASTHSEQDPRRAEGSPSRRRTSPMAEGLRSDRWPRPCPGSSSTEAQEIKGEGSNSGRCRGVTMVLFWSVRRAARLAL